MLVASLPTVFRNNLNLTFNGETDLAKYLIYFNTEMEVYQVTTLARYKLFAASLRENA